MPDRLSHLVERRRILLCVGNGGVGKTTIAASLAAAAAFRGRRVAVLTIDPAKRLKDSLGIPDLGSEPVRVPLDRVVGPLRGGELTAMMLDAKRTFDDLVARFAPSLEVAQEILANRLYQYVSGHLAGSQEYMALEKLYEIATGGRYDLLVVDTPPTHHALDFLEAPQRMVDLLASRAISFLREPSLAILGIGSRVAQAAVETILRALERFTGLSILKELADFVGSFEGMLDGFQQRATAVRRLLRDPDTSAILVTTPEPFTVHGSVAFYEDLEKAGLDLGAVVLNRTVPEALVAETDAAPLDLPRNVVDSLVLARRELQALAERDARMFREIRRKIGAATPIVTVPDQTIDVASLSGLVAIADTLVPGPSRPRSNVTPFPARAER